MKLISGSSIFKNALLHGLKAEGQRAYGVSRDMIVDSDDLARHDSLEDERKGYKYDEVADIRSLLDQFMTTTAADKALACFKSSTAKMDEWNKLEVPDNNDILMFFRTRGQDAAPQPAEATQEEMTPVEPVQPQEVVDNFAAAKQPTTKQRSKQQQQQQQQQAQQQGQGKKTDVVHKDPQSHDFRAQITGKASRKSLLQELAQKLKKQEAQAQVNSHSSRYPRQRKYHDSADYP